MLFYTLNKNGRPVRLCENTRKFAYESLHGKYGDDAIKNGSVSMDNEKDFEMLTETEKYNRTIRKISSEAPVRICESEKISGAATLGMAISHLVPATYEGKQLWMSISHLTLNFCGVLDRGVDALEADIKQYISEKSFTKEQLEFENSLLSVIDSMRIWHNRYLEALKDKLPENYNVLENVPFKAPKSFCEAVQSLWFMFAFTRLCGNWSGIGRIDLMLGKYLKKDLNEGKITIEEAREVLAHFFIKGCEWIQSNTPTGSGDAQHYQNIVLSGIDEEGFDATNEVTYLVLDVVEELGISDFPITVRVNKKTDEKLLRRVADVMSHGGGVIAVYNEDLIIRSLVDFGYEEREARGFANDGCWEVEIPGKTNFIYVPFDALQLLLNDTLRLNTDKPAHFDSAEELLGQYLKTLNAFIENLYVAIAGRVHKTDSGEWIWDKNMPCPVVSLFTEGCAERGLSYYEGGALYNTVSPHIGGAPDAGNSIYAIKKLVFDDKKVGFDELMKIIQNNWNDNEVLRQYTLNKYTYYGNDNDEADYYTNTILDSFADMVHNTNGRCPIFITPGVSTFGRQIEWAPFRCAVPFGRRKGDILSGNTSPSPGTDKEGATAIIKSYCKANMQKQTCGAALDIKLHPSAVSGENGIEALIGLTRGFVECGGYFMQLDIMDAEVLKKAQENPDEYKTLSVRVSGWNARFITLNSEWQRMIIERTENGI